MPALSSKKRDRLFESIKRSRDAQLKWRSARKEMLRDYVGDLYDQSSTYFKSVVTKYRRQILPLMWQFVSTYTHHLVAQSPRALVATRHLEKIPFCYQYREALNNLVCEIRLGDSLHAAVLDAMFGFGIVKTYSRDAGEILVGADQYVDPGAPYAERLSHDEIVWDNNAKSLRKLEFVEHTYELPRENLETDDRVDQQVLAKIKSGEYRMRNKDGESRAEDLSGDDDRVSYRETIKLREVWLPFEGKCVTYPEDPTLGELWEVELDDPDEGPYDFLWFDDVPDNVMPLSPASQLKASADSINSIWRVLVAQARRTKSIPWYRPNAVDDAMNWAQSPDGKAIKVNDPTGIGVFNLEAPDARLHNLAIAMEGEFKSAAGNLDVLAGLGPQSDTLGQDRMIEATVSKRMSKMQGRVLDFTTRIMRKLGRLLWDDAATVIPAYRDVEGYKVDASWTPEDRMGQYGDYDFDVIPYSMTPTSPSQRMAMLDATVQQVIVPLMPIIQQQGGTFNVQEYLQIKGELQNLPEQMRLIDWSMPPRYDTPSEDEVRQSAVTERHNVRHNAGGQDPVMAAQEMMQPAGMQAQPGMEAAA